MARKPKRCGLCMGCQSSAGLGELLLYYAILYNTVPYYTILYYPILSCTIPYQLYCFNALVQLRPQTRLLHTMACTGITYFCGCPARQLKWHGWLGSVDDINPA